MDREWLADLESPDGMRVVAALHRACPCSGSAHLYEQYMPMIQRFKKDPRPEVRLVALHLEVDALDQLAIADETAGGFRRNHGGRRNGRRELRRPELRYGLRD